MTGIATAETTTIRVPGAFYDWLMSGGWNRAKNMIADSTAQPFTVLALVFGKVSRALDDARVTHNGKVRHAVVDAETADMLWRVARVRAFYNNGPGDAAHLRAAKTTVDRAADAYRELTSQG